MMGSSATSHDVEGFASKGHLMNFCRDKFQVPDSKFRFQLLAFGEHLGRDVCRDDFLYVRSKSKGGMACSGRHAESELKKSA
jgi:hypothetical protein